MTKDSARLELSQIALQGFRERPLLGWGPDSFESAFRRYRSEAMVEFLGPKKVHIHAHSPAQLPLTAGIAGVLALLFLLSRVRRLPPVALAGAVAGGINLLVNPASAEGLCLWAFLCGGLAGGRLVRPSLALRGFTVVGLVFALGYYWAEFSHPFDANALLPGEPHYAVKTQVELVKWINEAGPEDRLKLAAYGEEVGEKLARYRPQHAPSLATAGALSYVSWQVTKAEPARVRARGYLDRAISLDPRQTPFWELLAALTGK